MFSLGVTITETERTQAESKNDLERIREIIFITVNRETAHPMPRILPRTSVETSTTS